MDIAAIFLLIEKGLTVANTLIEAGQSAAPAIETLKNLVTGAKQGTVTDADLTATEALLDAQIADFNTDLPPDTQAGGGS